jgi:hypothetical protein
LGLLTLIAVLEGPDGAAHWQATKDIVDGDHQTLRVVAAARILQAAVGIEGLTHGRGGRQVVFGPIEGEDGQAVPEILLSRRKDLIGQRHSVTE